MGNIVFSMIGIIIVVIAGIQIKNIIVRKKNNSARKDDSAKLPIIVFVLLIGIMTFVVGFYITDGGSAGSTNKCSICGRTWSAGDSGGNYMSIARRNMCVSCYNTYQGAKDFVESNQK